MLRFLYEGDYDDERDMAQPCASPPKPYQSPKRYSSFKFFKGRSWSKQSLLVNVQVYILADKNDIVALKKRAKEKYAEVVTFLWNTPSFAASAMLLYDNTPQSDRLLRDVIAETAEKHIKTLICEEDFVEVMVRNGDLAVDVLKSVLSKEIDSDSELDGMVREAVKIYRSHRGNA